MPESVKSKEYRKLVSDLKKEFFDDFQSNIESQVQEGIEAIKLAVENQIKGIRKEIDKIDERLDQRIVAINNNIPCKKLTDIIELKIGQKRLEGRDKIFTFFARYGYRVAIVGGIILIIIVLIKCDGKIF
jgi:hypothetical protein